MIKTTITGIISSDPKEIVNGKGVTFDISTQTNEKEPSGKRKVEYVTVESWNKYINPNLLKYPGNKKGNRALVIGSAKLSSYFSKAQNKQITKMKVSLEHIETFGKGSGTVYDEPS